MHHRPPAGGDRLESTTHKQYQQQSQRQRQRQRRRRRHDFHVVVVVLLLVVTALIPFLSQWQQSFTFNARHTRQQDNATGTSVLTTNGTALIQNVTGMFLIQLQNSIMTVHHHTTDDNHHVSQIMKSTPKKTLKQNISLSDNFKSLKATVPPQADNTTTTTTTTTTIADSTTRTFVQHNKLNRNSTTNHSIDMIQRYSIKNNDDDDDDGSSNRHHHHRPVCILHFGPHKTGTTSIQRFLLQHKRELRDHDKYNPSMILGHDNGKQLDVLYKCIKLGLQCHKPGQEHHEVWQQSLQTIIDIGVKEKKNLLISNEEFAHANLEETNQDWHILRSLLQTYYDVRVVLVYRRYWEWLSSYYNQHYKVAGPFRKKLWKWPDLTTTSENSTKPIILKRRKKQILGVPIPSFPEYWNQRLHNTVQKDPFVINNQWDAQRQRPCHDAVQIRRKLRNQSMSVMVLNYHVDNDIVTRFVCQALVNATKSCTAAKNRNAGRRNLSFQHDLDRIACEAKKQNLLPATMERLTAKRQVKAFLQQQNKSIDELPNQCLEPYQQMMLKEISYSAETEIMPNAIATFNSSFDNAVSHGKFCSVDVQAVVQLSEWNDFFASLST